jgi:hypothetical protein
MPQERNRVSLAEETDQHGLPIARVTYSWCDNDKRLNRHALEQMRMSVEMASARECGPKRMIPAILTAPPAWGAIPRQVSLTPIAVSGTFQTFGFAMDQCSQRSEELTHRSRFKRSRCELPPEFPTWRSAAIFSASGRPLLAGDPCDARSGSPRQTLCRPTLTRMVAGHHDGQSSGSTQMEHPVLANRSGHGFPSIGRRLVLIDRQVRRRQTQFRFAIVMVVVIPSGSMEPI